MDDLIAYLREHLGKPRPCAIGGALTDPKDLLETYLPSRVVGPGPGFPLSFVVMSGARVCPRCSAFATPQEGGEAIEE
jgi:hypothetical protein